MHENVLSPAVYFFHEHNMTVTSLQRLRKRNCREQNSGYFEFAGDGYGTFTVCDLNCTLACVHMCET